MTQHPAYHTSQPSAYNSSTPYMKSNYTSFTPSATLPTSFNKQNISYLSNQLSSPQTQYLQKTIQLKNQYIQQLLEEIKKTKESYQNFRNKLVKDNQALKNENQRLKKEQLIWQKHKQTVQHLNRQKQHQIKQYNNHLKLLKQQKHAQITQLTLKLQKNQSTQKQHLKTIFTLTKKSQNLTNQNSLLKTKIQSQIQTHLNQINQQKSIHQKLKQSLLIVQEENQKLTQEIQRLRKNKSKKEHFQTKLDRLESKIGNIIMHL